MAWRPLVLALAALLWTPMVWGQIVLTTEFQDTQPKFILSEQGPDEGLCVDILRLVAAQGFDFPHPRQYVPINRIVDDLRTGQIDAYCGLSRTPEREAQFRYVRLLFQTRYQLVARRGSVESRLTSLADLRELGTPVMVIRGTSSAQYFEDLPEIPTADAPVAVLNALRRVVSGDARLFGYYDLGNSWFLRRPEFASLVALPLRLDADPEWFCVSRTVPETTVAALGAALDRVMASPEWAALTKRYFESARLDAQPTDPRGADAPLTGRVRDRYSLGS